VSQDSERTLKPDACLRLRQCRLYLRRGPQ